MDEVRTAAAMSGHVDPERLLHDAAKAFSRADSPEALDAEWRRMVAPVYSQLGEDTLSLLSRLHALNLTAMSLRMK